MQLLRKALRQGASFAFFRFLSQLFSWCITIIVARILVPEDYGLMAVSYILIGYIERFRELGLGAAIIQKPEMTKEELSSIFWFALGYSILLYFLCYFLSYPTAVFFKNEKIIPLIQVISITFIITGLQIVPSCLIRKQLDFKKIGILELIATTFSSISMLIAANIGAGVWTLVIGHIGRSTINLLLIFPLSNWRPDIFFNIKNTFSYLKFGMIVSMSRTFFYVNENVDTFFAGRAWSANSLGYYTMAIQLSKIPMDKIISIVQQVSFSLFANIQSEPEKIIYSYSKVIKLIATIVFPLYLGGYLLGDELVTVLLGQKWIPIIFLFKFLCLAQIVTPISSINNPIHVALGRPKISLVYYLSSAILMSASFFIAVQYGTNAIIIPWITIYIIINIAWTLFTINKISISLYNFIKIISKPALCSFIMIIALMIFEQYDHFFPPITHLSVLLIIKIFVIAGTYLLSLWLVDKESIVNFKKYALH